MGGVGEGRRRVVHTRSQRILRSREPTTLFRAICEVATARLGAVHGSMSGGVAIPAFFGSRGLVPVVDHCLNRVPPSRQQHSKSVSVQIMYDSR